MIRVALVNIGEISLYTALLVIEPFRAANRLSDRDAYSISLLSSDHPVQVTIPGFSIPTLPIREAQGQFDVILVLSCYECPPQQWRPALAWVKAQERHGALIGALDNAVMYFAISGLLDGYRVAAHWALHSVLEEKFAAITLVDKRFEIDRKRATSPGHMAAVDLSLEVIEQMSGGALTRAVRNDIIYPERPEQTQSQVQDIYARNPYMSQGLRKVIEAMKQNICPPLALSEIADLAEMEPRAMQRAFLRMFGQSPKQYYTTLRLQQARGMLQFSDMNVHDIASAVGFSSYAGFFKSFRSRFGSSPTDCRKDFQEGQSLPNGRRVY
ncbi:helix-turn-helix domain-containing protein [Xinfangfangia sp. CPCC 101601]|uniref:Helix-turn-helix domain-containing protein n=1 Tax=Pseudogemmobacter lacusdianii TaxID=3069608 RepID=A0ABU0W1S1_9RHOB|nr:helix-turn-helix domain-containing protein [Xinfangfangia sp. CPCC 101601]MDQ2067953.1 helix-turn-helix domain-containing protein [Xinfangfangia sp. CPCC 101601]